MYFIAPGLGDNKDVLGASTFMTRVMFPYIGFMSFVALAGGILNTWHEFKFPAFTSVLLNLAFIVASLFVAPYMQHPIYAMAFAVLVGGILQVAIQIPALIKVGMLPRLAMNPMTGLRDLGVQRVLKKMGPAVFAVSAAKISLLITPISLAPGPRQRLVADPRRPPDGFDRLAGRRSAPYCCPVCRKPMPTKTRSNILRCWTGACASPFCWRCRPQSAWLPWRYR